LKLPFYVDLKGKTAVVTGGAGVLCSQMAKALGACGANVAILNRTLEKGEKVAAEIGDNAMAVQADVLDIEALKRARDLICDKWGKVTILINGAGGNNPSATTDDEEYDAAGENIKDFFQLDAGKIRDVFDLNYQGTLLPTQVFAQEMVGMPGATVINISSMSGFRPLTKVLGYSGAKAAINNLTQWMAIYFAKSGLRVNAIAPGFYATDQNRTLLFKENGEPTLRTGKILAATPMGRFGEAEELIGTLLYLISPEASGFVNGVVIPVDGGFNAYSGV
jgi:NAD(P)-dependent dehydrogenase (short-subunit alcohol dehydrogenase family)